MAAVEGFERGYLGTLMRLTLLSPAILEATGAGIKTGKVKLSDYGNFDARCGTAFLSGSRLPCFNHFAIIQSLPCHAALISTLKFFHGV